MGTKQLTSQVAISDGPSKFDLMFALFDAYQQRGGKTSIRRVVFETEIGSVEAVITSVGIEDRSNESWLISGSFCRYESNLLQLFRFEGYYSTRRRKGFLGPVKNQASR